MARKSSGSNRSRRARRTSSPRRAKTVRTRTEAKKTARKPKRAATPGRPDGDGASESIENRSRLGGSGLGATETSGERQGMGRGHRRNFDESDDDATTRGQSPADETSEMRDSGVHRRSHAMNEPMSRGRTSPPGGRSGHRSDW